MGGVHWTLTLIAYQAGQEPIVEQLQREQLAISIRQLLAELKIQRDRQILRRYYLTEEPKASICQALDVTPEHFDRVLHRARQRFRKLVEQHLGKDFNHG